jgi:ketosteroid isomerase-like protein
MMKRYLLVSLAVLACLMVAARRSPHSDINAADAAAVRAQIDRYVRTALAADFDAWGNTLAPDVIVMPPNQAPLVGRSAAVAFGKAFPKLTSFSVSVDEVTGRRDIAYARGTYAYTATMPGGSSVSEKGSFLEIHQRTAEGTWPYTRLMWHADMPPAVLQAAK